MLAKGSPLLGDTWTSSFDLEMRKGSWHQHHATSLELVWGVDKSCPNLPACYHCNSLRGWSLSPLGADKNHLSPKQECFMLSF